MLWEKKKFVTETQYCVAMGSVAPEFYPEIVANSAQWMEWRDLIGVDEAARSVEFLQSHPTLMLDTRHFSADGDFTDRLLASFDDLDGITDGLLIHSENWQALRLLGEKYKGAVKCIYIDPPYNSPASEIIYKNGYKHSSYLSLINDRVHISKVLINDNAVYAVSIDENEFERVSTLLKSLLNNMAHTAITIIHNPAGQQGQNFSYSHDYACFAYRPDSGRQIGQEVRQSKHSISNFRDWGGEESRREVARNCFYPIYIKDGDIISFGDVCDPNYHPSSANMPADDGMVAVFPIDRQGVERKWRFSRSTVESVADEIFPHFVKTRKTWDIRRSKNTFNFKTVWTESKYFGNNHGTQILNHILGGQNFDYPKSVHTVEDFLRAGFNNNAYATALDYFAGSGTTAHAVINLNREDGGQRKFILVEMGEHFKNVLLPRVKKIAYTPDWTEGKPKRSATDEEAERSPRIVKYMRLESYEDALDCIEFDADTEQMRLEERNEDYLIKYMLEWETRDSDTLLNVRNLTRPFHYKLRSHANGATREQAADVPETFNYLLGLNVKTRQVYDHNGRRYLVYRGEKREAQGKEVAVIWRDTEGWTEDDYERDRAFVVEEICIDDADKTYINGASCIPGVTELEPLFRDRMFAPLTA